MLVTRGATSRAVEVYAVEELRWIYDSNMNRAAGAESS
jgi:hypothetical protein